MYVGQVLPELQKAGRADLPVARVAFAGGGTGGHLAPGLAIAHEIHRRVPSDVLFFTTGRPVEQAMLDETPFTTEQIHAAPPAGGLGGMTRFAWKTTLGVWQSIRALRRHQTQGVVALGGYTAVPVAIAAKILGLPVVVCEQNAIAGRAVTFLSRFSRLCLTQWPLGASSLHPRCQQAVVGNPVRRTLFDSHRQTALGSLGLSHKKRTLLIMGGSQGATAINQWVVSHRYRLEAAADRVQAIVLTGADHASYTQAMLADLDNVVVLPFAHDMGRLYAAADLVLGRAGATTMAECTALGLPMVLVPYPHAAAGHQLENALYAARAGAAMVVDQQHLDGSTWDIVLDGLLLDDWNRYAMRDASARLGRPRAAMEAGRAIVTHLNEAAAARGRFMPRPFGTPERQRMEAIWRSEREAAFVDTPAGHPAESVSALDHLESGRAKEDAA